MKGAKMVRLGDYAEEILLGLQHRAKRIIRKYLMVEVQEEPIQSRREQQPTLAGESAQPLRPQIEAAPRIPLEEVSIVGPLTESRTAQRSKGVSRIGKTFSIKGEVFANEDLNIEGRIVGKIEIKDHQLAIGPEAIVHADIRAKNVSVEGKLVGNISADGMVTIQSTGSLVGGISAAKIAINEGAHFKGTVDIILAKAQSAIG